MGGAAPATEARLAPRRPSQAGPGKGWASDAGSEVVAVLRQNLAARCTGRSYICPTNTDELVTKRSSCFLFDETTATPAMSSTRGHAHWDPAISIPTLVGSAVSVLATTTVILLWTFAPGKKRRDFRYALILNLTVAGQSRLARGASPRWANAQRRVHQQPQQYGVGHCGRCEEAALGTGPRMQMEWLDRAIFCRGKLHHTPRRGSG